MNSGTHLIFRGSDRIMRYNVNLAFMDFAWNFILFVINCSRGNYIRLFLPSNFNCQSAAECLLPFNRILWNCFNFLSLTVLILDFNKLMHMNYRCILGFYLRTHFILWSFVSSFDEIGTFVLECLWRN